MKITIVTGPFLPLPPASCGAVEKIWYDLGNKFAEMGNSVAFLCRSHDLQKAFENIEGMTFIRKTSFKRSSSICLDLLKDFIYSLIMYSYLPKADILVTNTFWLPIFASMLNRNSGAVVVNVARMPKGQIKLYSKVDRLSAVSTAVGDNIITECPRAASITKVIPNPVDTTIHTLSEDRYNSKDKTILYTGRVHPEKGLHLLVRAFKLLLIDSPNLKLRIVGPANTEQGGGGEQYFNALIKIAYELPVEFIGQINDPRMLTLEYRKAYLFCYPSLSEKGESFGVAPLEAMATGLVPIVSHLKCFSDFIEDGKTGYFFDHRSANPEKTLYNILRKALHNDKLLDLGRQAALKAAQFSNKNIALQYIEDWERMLQNKSKKS